MEPRITPHPKDPANNDWVLLSAFDTGAHTLHPEHKDWLNKHALAAAKTGGWIHLRGLASKTGDEQFNMALSQRRADAVRDYLLANGVQDEQITGVDAKGEEWSKGGENNNDPMWRSVEVILDPITEEEWRQQILKDWSIVSRSQWGALPPKQPHEKDWNYTTIVIHHSGNWGIKNPKGIEKEHRENKGFWDVGYHYMIHPDGHMYEGRKIYFKGSNVRNGNTGKLGILMLGDYNHQAWDKDDTLHDSHVDQAIRFVNYLKGVFPLSILGGHKTFMNDPTYTCPGNQLMKVIPKMQKETGLAAP